MQKAPEFVRSRVPLAPLTTLKLGGDAEYFTSITTDAELVEALRWAKTAQMPTTVLGGGSNVVVSDEGVAGLVIQLGQRALISAADGLVRASAGEPWDAIVEHSVKENLAGIECLSGIPGLAGATPIQNVGAYGQEVSERIVWVRVLERENLEERIMQSDDCQFSYRNSYFKENPSKYVVMEVAFLLIKNGAPALRYKELTDSFAEKTPTLEQVRARVIELRRKKSMVITEDDENSHSAGSFFTNPVLTSKEIDELRNKTGAEVPTYTAPDAKLKVPAAWLIERAGFSKGYQKGRVGISTKHSLALVNHGGSTKELLALASDIQRGVKKRFGVQLAMEPVLLA